MCSPRRGHHYSAIQGIAWYCVLEAWYIHTIASSVRFCCWHYNCRRHALLVAATAFSCSHRCHHRRPRFSHAAPCTSCTNFSYQHGL